VSYQQPGPLARRQAQVGGPRSRGRRWLIAIGVALVLLVVAGLGGRNWWAEWLGGVTNGSHTANFLIGLLVGLLPLIGVAIGSLGHHRRRVLRMFVLGAAGFIATDILAPSLTTAIRHHGGTATKPFETHVPGYLTGVYTAVAISLVLLVFVIVRMRRARRARRYNR